MKRNLLVVLTVLLAGQLTMGLYHELGRLTQKKIPNLQLVELKDVGHLPHVEVFDKFIRPLLLFLKE